MADVKYFADLVAPSQGDLTDDKIMAMQSDPKGAAGWKPTLAQLKVYFGSAVPTAIEDNLTIAAPGQTAFTLSNTPLSDAAFALYLNGQLREITTDYTRSGTSLTWLDPGGLTLLTTDVLVARYNDGGSGHPVTSVFGRTGAVTAQSGDYTVAQVTGAAASGANSDITSLLGLTTPLLIAQGGTNSGAALANGKVIASSGGAIVESAVDITSLTAPKSHLAPADYGSNYNNRRVRSVGATGTYRLNFNVPKNFTGTLAIKLIGYPVSGAGGAGKDIDLVGEYTNSAGASSTQFTFSDTTSTYNTGTDDTRMELDITALFPNATAGTEGGIFVDHKGIGGSINYIGVEVTST